jgi:hypothetical protein
MLLTPKRHFRKRTSPIYDNLVSGSFCGQYPKLNKIKMLRLSSSQSSWLDAVSFPVPSLCVEMLLSGSLVLISHCFLRSKDAHVQIHAACCNDTPYAGLGSFFLLLLVCPICCCAVGCVTINRHVFDDIGRPPHAADKVTVSISDDLDTSAFLREIPAPYRFVVAS